MYLAIDPIRKAVSLTVIRPGIDEALTLIARSGVRRSGVRLDNRVVGIHDAERR